MEGVFSAGFRKLWSLPFWKVNCSSNPFESCKPILSPGFIAYLKIHIYIYIFRDSFPFWKVTFAPCLATLIHSDNSVKHFAHAWCQLHCPGQSRTATTADVTRYFFFPTCFHEHQCEEIILSVLWRFYDMETVSLLNFRLLSTQKPKSSFKCLCFFSSFLIAC